MSTLYYKELLTDTNARRHLTFAHTCYFPQCFVGLSGQGLVMTPNGKLPLSDGSALCQKYPLPSALIGIWARRPRIAGNIQSWRRAWWPLPGDGVSGMMWKERSSIFLIGQCLSPGERAQSHGHTAKVRGCLGNCLACCKSGKTV